MKLSEAIRMNGMMKPQGHGHMSMMSIDRPCALGGALQIISAPQEMVELFIRWPWTVKSRHLCPACLRPDKFSIIREEFRCSAAIQGAHIIWHLNDSHLWTRQQIADWVETVEPQEVAEVVSVVEEVLTHQ